MLLFVYYIGIAACGIQGAEKSKFQSPERILIASFLAAFGGGLIRDILLLNTHPVVFTLNCIPDISIALLSGYLYSKISNQRLVKWVSIFADAAGLGQFISIGVDKANNMGGNDIIAFICGITTALGGGILSSIFCGVSIRKIISTNIIYRVWTLWGTVIYIFLLNSGEQHSFAQLIIVVYTIITITASNQEAMRAMKYIRSKQLDIRQPVVGCLITARLQLMILMFMAFRDILFHRIKDTYNKKIINPFIYRRKIIILHRIQQM